MSTLRQYVAERKAREPAFADGYDDGYRNFKIGVMLRQEREGAGVTQEEVARRLRTKKSAISRVENHAEDIRLSTLEKFVSVIGRKIEIKIA